jgi:hypothetical protein
VNIIKEISLLGYRGKEDDTISTSAVYSDMSNILKMKEEEYQLRWWGR